MTIADMVYLLVLLVAILFFEVRSYFILRDVEAYVDDHAFSHYILLELQESMDALEEKLKSL